MMTTITDAIVKIYFNHIAYTELHQLRAKNYWKNWDITKGR